MVARAWIIPSLTWIKKLRFNEEPSTRHNLGILGVFFPSRNNFPAPEENFSPSSFSPCWVPSALVLFICVL